MRLGTPGFVGERLVEAREARGITIKELSIYLGISRQAIAQYEKGQISPSNDALNALCKILQVPRDFFLKEPFDDSEFPVLYRSLRSARVKSRKRVEREFVWLKEIVYFLKTYVSFPKLNVPTFGEHIDPRYISDDDIEDFAVELRRGWGLKNGPLSDVILLLETNGVLVSSFDLNDQKLDAFSDWSKALDTPFVVLNSLRNNTVRTRFNAAHELAHLLLHSSWTAIQSEFGALRSLLENQAHRFAGAFLLPEESFATDLISPQLDAMVALKSKWRVSIAAMIMRCEQIGLINEAKAEKLWIQLSQRGWKRKEPLDDELPPESPRYLERCFKLLLEKSVLTPDAVESMIGLSKGDIERVCSLPKGFFDEYQSVGPEPEIIQFPVTG